MRSVGEAPSVLIVTPVAETGGSDQALLRMARSLTGAGWRVDVAVPAASPLASQFRAARVRLHVVPMRRITTTEGWTWWARYVLEWPSRVLRLWRLVRRLDVDVVATNSLHSWYAFAAAALARRPHVWHARELVVQSRLALRLERRLVRTATTVVACSHAVADQLDGVVKGERLVVVHEDVDRTAFHPERAGSFRETIACPADSPLVGFVGRIDTWKGLDVLLEAWPEVSRARSRSHLVVVGGPVAGKDDYYRALERRAGGLERVRWVGHVDDVADVMADLDVFTAPSTLPEPYGLVLVEALAGGARVVATTPGGPAEILARARPGAGRLVPPDDPVALAGAILALLPHVVLGAADRQPLIDPFPYDWAALYARAALVDSRPMGMREPLGRTPRRRR